MIDNTKLVEILESRHACDPALEWLEQRNSDEMWEHCERPDWLLWWAARHVPRKELVLVACQCARLALPYVDAGEIRPIKAIETAEAWTRGEVELEEVKGAANAAYYAANAAYYAARAAADDAHAAALAAALSVHAAYYAARAAADDAHAAALAAANAAARTADAACAASRAASRAAYAALAADDAHAAAYAANAAYYAADAACAASRAASRAAYVTRTAAQSRMCEIIRQQWPTCPEPGRKG
jgi:hypothetical protein